MKRLIAIILAVVMVLPAAVVSSGASCGVGDVDGDGAIAASDYLALRDTIKTGGEYSGTLFELADVNDDGLITSVDLLSLGAAVRGEVSLPGHSYDNSCDTTCNHCGEVRAITHTYDNACDAACNVCGATRTPAAHVYSNTCDTTCNVCGAVRTITHTYDDNFDTTCNVCGHVREVNYDIGSIVVGVNIAYIGDGYKEKVQQAFAAYLATTDYVLDIEYRDLGTSTSSGVQIGEIVLASGDIDVVLAAGANINTDAGVPTKAKVLLLDEYNSDGKRYSALITEELGAVLFHNFVSGDTYHVHTYDNDEDLICNTCGYERAPLGSVTLENGTTVNFVSSKDTAADVTPSISGSSVIFTADSDNKDEAWEIDLGGEKLDPNTIYTVKFSLYNSVGSTGVGCVRDKYLSNADGVNTFYGNYTGADIVSTVGRTVRARRGLYEIQKLDSGSTTDFDYDNAYVDSEGYVSLKLDVKFNGTTYVSTLYYLNSSSVWVAVESTKVGISSSNTFGLYVLHGATGGCVTKIKDIKYTIEDAGTSYSTDVSTPALKIVDYNLKNNNTWWTATSNWLLGTGADIIGLQEVGWQNGTGWYVYLRNIIGGTYGDVGTPRQGWGIYNTGNEANPIFYNKTTCTLLDSGTKWLSSTPDTVGSKISGSGYIRVMTYTMLYHKETGNIFIYTNTHLDNASDGSVRVKQMQIIMDLLDDLLPGYPTILSGDFNGGTGSDVVAALKNTHGYYNLAVYAATKTSTYTTYTYPSGSCVLDYIFYSDNTKFNALSYMVGNNSSRCSVYNKSDHYPLIATFSLK